MTTNVWKLNTQQTVRLEHVKGGHCTIEPIRDSNAFIVSLYNKGKRLPYKGLSIVYASKALEYANSLGYR